MHLEVRGMVHTLEQAKWLVDDQKRVEDIVAVFTTLCAEVVETLSEDSVRRSQARELQCEAERLVQAPNTPDRGNKHADLSARMMKFLAAREISLKM